MSSTFMRTLARAATAGGVHEPWVARMALFPGGGQEDYIEPRAKVVRPRGGVVSPIANAGLELDRPTPKFDELGNFEINRH